MSEATKPIKKSEVHDSKYCSSCGKLIKKEAEICPKCGVRQYNATHASTANVRNPKSKVTAGILALLLGGLGIHKFYLGSPVGIVYLLFCWTFIPSFIGFIEGIIYLTFSGTDEEFTAKYSH